MRQTTIDASSEAAVWFLISAIRSTEQNNRSVLTDSDSAADLGQLGALELLKRHDLLQQLRMFLLHFFIGKCLIFRTFEQSFE